MKRTHSCTSISHRKAAGRLGVQSLRARLGLSWRCAGAVGATNRGVGHRDGQKCANAFVVENRRWDSVGRIAYGSEQRSEGAALSTRYRVGVMLGVVRGGDQMAIGVRLRAQLCDQDDQCQCERPARASLDSK